MGLYRRGKTYWYSFVHNGKRLQESTGTDNKRLAEKICAKVLSEVVEGRYFETARAKRITFGEMVGKYLRKHEKQRDPRTLKVLLPVFGKLTIAEITTEMLSDYREERLKTVKPATVYQELALMRRMFNVARREWKWIKENPVADLSFSVGNKNARTRWLTTEEENRLIEQAADPSWLRLFLIVALHTGMRKGEILGLQWKSIDFHRGTLTVERSKNGEKRTIPMNRTLRDALLAVKVRNISGRVFPISGWTLRAAFDRTVKRAGIADFRIHDLRHTFATRLVQHGTDIYKVKELLGHKSLSMTMRYAHHYPESLRSSVEILDVCYNSATVGSGVLAP